MKSFWIVLMLALVPTSLCIAAEVEIPRSIPGDKGRYYLVELSRDGEIVKALHRRVGVDVTSYTRTETNCATMKMRETGYSESSAAEAVGNGTKWFELVEGSSKSDLARFVCKRRQ